MVLLWVSFLRKPVYISLCTLLLAGWLSGATSWSRVFYMLMGANCAALVALARLVRNELTENKYATLPQVKLEEKKNYKTFP